VTPEVAVVGISRLDDHVLLADAALAMGMVTAGAGRLVDLRGETKPPGLPIPIDHFPIMDLEGGQEDLILAAARHVHAVRPQAMPALELWRSLEHLGTQLAS
jgi:hypothetical protein